VYRDGGVWTALRDDERNPRSSLGEEAREPEELVGESNTDQA
jgi:hypothetical protein